MARRTHTKKRVIKAASSGRAGLAQSESEQVPVGRLTPRLASQPVEDRCLCDLRFQAAAAPIIPHVRPQARQLVFFKRLTRHFALRLTLLVIERTRLLAAIGRV